MGREGGEGRRGWRYGADSAAAYAAIVPCRIVVDGGADWLVAYHGSG